MLLIIIKKKNIKSVVFGLTADEDNHISDNNHFGLEACHKHYMHAHVVVTTKGDCMLVWLSLITSRKREFKYQLPSSPKIAHKKMTHAITNMDWEC